MRILVLAVIAACHQDGSAPRVLTSPTASATAASSTANAPADAGAWSPITVTAMGPGSFEIENTSGKTVKLMTVAPIETQGGAPLWLELGKGYELLEQCPTTPPKTCVELAPGATLRPVPWTGFTCSAQCNGDCDKNVWVGIGTYRLVVKACESMQPLASLAFPMATAPAPGAMARFGLMTNPISATIARLELPTQSFALGAPATSDHIAGFAVKPGTERALSAELLGDLVELVVAPSGFDDKIAKRCLMTDLVGVRVVRHPPTTGAMKEDVVEIAFDQTCSKFFAVRGDASHRVEMATHYDPQRPAFLAWAKRSLLP
jgi:hypothetical protein